MLRPLERVIDQKMNECDLLGFRLMNSFDGADQTIFETRILLFYKSRNLSIGRCPPQRQYERFKNGEQNGGEQSQPQQSDRPPGNAGGICEHKADQERHHHDAQDPRQASEPQERLPTASCECNLPEQLFMWRHAYLLNCL